MCSATQTRPFSTRWWIAVTSSSSGTKAAPLKICCSGARICVFQLARKVWSCSCGSSVSTPATQPCHWPRTSATSASAWATRSSSSSAEGMSLASSLLPSGRLPLVKNSVNASASASLFCSDSSMLMRSMPSVYSAMRGSGITTSSLILKALVCLLMAAVRLRSSQNFLRASGLMAI